MSADTVIAEFSAKIGEDLGVSDWITMNQRDFDTFADVTGDKDWLHNDPERCKTDSPFGGKTIAQGHLLLSNLTRVAESLIPQHDDVAFGLNYGYDRVRVIQPVTVGSRIRGRLKLMEIQKKDESKFVVKTEATIESEGQSKPSLVAQWLFFVQLKAS